MVGVPVLAPSVSQEAGTVLVVVVLLFEGEAELAEQGASFFVVRCRGDNGDVHASGAVDLVDVQLVEHGLFGEAEGVVAVAVELCVG